MTQSSLMEGSQLTSSRPKATQTLLVGAGCLGILLAPHIGVPMFLYPLLGLALCAVLLRCQGLAFADIGFRWRAMGIGPLVLGGGLGIAYAAINYMAIGPLLAYALGDTPDLTSFSYVHAHLSGFLLALVLAWVIGGIYEELIFRGLLHAILLRHLPVARGRSLMVVILVALAFAAYHWQLGTFGVANALVFAVFAAAIRQRWPENLWYVINFHAFADMMAFTLMRLGYL